MIPCPSLRTLLVLALLALAAGCSVGPDYRRPEPLPGGASLPPRFKEAGAAMEPARPADTQPRGPWWTVFGDPLLDQLMTRLEAANQDLAAAEARYRQAISVQAQAQATLWPIIGGNAGATRTKAGANSPVTNTVQIGLAASWEVDLWGKAQRSIEASRAATEAAAADQAAVRLSLQAQLASSYFALRFLDAQQRLLNDTVQAYEHSLTLTRNRYEEGVAARVDVAQAEAQLQSTKAQAIEIGVQRASLEHAVALLLGTAPADFSLAPRDRLALILPLTPVQLPTRVLERRPDVAAAERQVAAANARIGVAVSAYFPSLTLDASGGYRSSALDDLVKVPNRVWSVGSDLALTLFDAGARRAATDEARALYDQQVAGYRQTVLIALQETEDSLATLRILQKEAVEQQRAVEAARVSADLTLRQYRAGTVSYLNVIVVQAARLAAERTLLGIQGQQYAAAVALIRAIGGGWEAGKEGI